MKDLDIRILYILNTRRRWNKLAQGVTFSLLFEKSPIHTSARTTIILTGIFVDFLRSLKVHAGRADDHFLYTLFNSLFILQFHLIRCKRKVTQHILKYLLKAVREPIFLDS